MSRASIVLSRMFKDPALFKLIVPTHGQGKVQTRQTKPASPGQLESHNTVHGCRRGLSVEGKGTSGSCASRKTSSVKLELVRGAGDSDGANRPPSEGVECRLGSSIIKTASPKAGDSEIYQQASGYTLS